MTQQRKHGFTLVELMLSMSFISLLLLGIAMLTIQIGTVYNKGITLREVNQAGQLISSDMQRALNITAPTAVSFANGAEGGRLCVGTTIYAWNFGDYIGQAGAFNTRENGVDTDIRLVKFSAPVSEEFCNRDPTNGNQYPRVPNSATELIEEGDRDVALHTFSMSTNPIDGAQTMYTIAFVLGTTETGTIDASGFCQPPTSSVDDSYCAVNQFNFVARAGNKSE